MKLLYVIKYEWCSCKLIVSYQDGYVKFSVWFTKMYYLNRKR